jgi:predicted Zn finger-like uncharacterized protein
MIIQCPACPTRYEIRALPPEGRPVRCAKCGTVWRPEPLIEDSVGFESSAQEPPAPDSEDRSSGESRMSADSASGASGETDEADDSENARSDAGSGAAAETREEEAGAAGDGAPKVSRSGGWSWAVRNPRGGQPLPGGPDISAALGGAQDDESGPGPAPASLKPLPSGAAESGEDKVRWFDMFRKGGRDHKGRPAEESEEAGSEDEPRGKTIPFPGPMIQPAAMAAGLAEDSADEGARRQSLEDARAAVRGVFASLSDGQPRQAGRAHPGHAAPILSNASAMPEAGAEDQEGSEAAAAAASNYNGWRDHDPSGASQDEESSGFGYGDGEYLRSQPSEHDDGPLADAEGEGEAEGDFSETGASPGSHDWMSAANGADMDAEARAFDERLTQELEQSLRQPAFSEDENPSGEMSGESLASPPWRRPQPLDGMEPDASPMVEDVADDYGSPDRQIEDHIVRQIEARAEYRPLERDAGRRGGGLVLAAAWGLFLCFVSGLGVAFISFRDVIANELPGTAPLYRTLGWPITVQPLMLEDVGYKWAVTEAGKPMIVVSGTLVNQAQRKMPVPLLYVGVKDQDKALDREFKTFIQAGRSKLRPGQRANFAIELVSPKPTIRAVELEIRHVR